MKKVIRLTESDLVRIVKKIIKEQDDKNISSTRPTDCERSLKDAGVELPLKNADYKKMAQGIRDNDPKYFLEWRQATDNAYKKETDSKKKSAISGYKICVLASFGR
jgi:hypothetical protein